MKPRPYLYEVKIELPQQTDQIHPNDAGRQVVHIPRTTLLIGFLLLIVLVIFVFRHLGDASSFVSLLGQVEPRWLPLVILLQLATYGCVGMAWNTILRTGGQRVRLRELSRMAVEKLSVDQLVPAVGLSGNLVVFQAMKRSGIPHARALETILVNILAHYIAYAWVALAAWITLWRFHDTTSLTLSLLGGFAAIVLTVPVGIIWWMARKDRPLPAWMGRIRSLRRMHADIREVSPDRVFAPFLLVIATLLNLSIFLLDAGTLWACLRAVGQEVHFLTTFVALVMASIAATLSLLPGGVGGFEAGAVAVLHMLGVPVEAALAGTLLLRGFTLWLPLIPGIMFARRDVLLKL